MMRATELLKDDHTTIARMLEELEALGPREGDARQQLVDKIADALDAHTTLEEELFYPALARVSGRVATARVQHEEIERLLEDLAGRPPSTNHWAHALTALKQAILRHVAAEEDVLFVEAERLGAAELERLGQAMRRRRETLRGSIVQRGLRWLRQFGRKTA
jgi:hemerythrin-like domain-containing protein